MIYKNYDIIYSIIGVYSTLIFVVAKLFRQMLSGSYYHIMLTELPNVNKILELCRDIYLVHIIRYIIIKLFFMICVTYCFTNTIIN